MRSLVLLAALLIGAPAALAGEASTIAGAPQIIDARTLRVGETTVRLSGIQPPQPGETCRWRAKTIACGAIARSALLDLSAGARVRCTLDGGRDADGVPWARCWAGGYDLAHGMVHTGWALADRQRGSRYADVEAEAAAKKRGLWQGEFALRKAARDN